MSVFSRIRQSKKAAKEHKAKAAAAEAPKVVKVPYKHVPTHAAVDALSGAPSSWKHTDRSKIKEHHQRRSQMVISRAESTTSFANAAIGSSSNLPRNSSYSSYNPTWFDRGGDVYYHSREPTKPQSKSRGHSYQDSALGGSIGPSPLAQSEDASPAISSGNSSTSSSENLEIAQAPKLDQVSQRPQAIVYAEKDIFERLHTSTTRKLGEAPLYDSPPVEIKTPATNVVALEQKQKKSRWSLMSKKSNATVVA
ncbi:hypothetical protein G7Y89_g14506 [Cudoniella acicularis]|uniref:Uncharacterized protein n=1 Tax=Cudoniella acicularis TaxID=354080 RepID=A0A8H4VTJ5_9HELO|nr:hypothetical protein G7Y89_g14506 [Cudoniella acicularis]